MALALENQRNVWRKVEQFLDSHDAGTATSAAVNAFRALKEWLASTANATQFQFVPFSAALIVTNTGYSPIGEACRVYGLYGKNTGGSDGTDSFLALHDAADNASAALVATVIQDDNDEVTWIDPNGMAFATDLTISGATTIGGATESAAADACDGFVIVGAA